MARTPTTSDVLNAIAEVRRREILDALMAGEKAERLDRMDDYLQELQRQESSSDTQ